MHAPHSHFKEHVFHVSRISSLALTNGLREDSSSPQTIRETKAENCTLSSILSVVMFCFVFFLKFWLPLGLHSSYCISQMASGTLKKMIY